MAIIRTREVVGRTFDCLWCTERLIQSWLESVVVLDGLMSFWAHYHHFAETKSRAICFLGRRCLVRKHRGFRSPKFGWCHNGPCALARLLLSKVRGAQQVQDLTAIAATSRGSVSDFLFVVRFFLLLTQCGVVCYDSSYCKFHLIPWHCSLAWHESVLSKRRILEPKSTLKPHTK